MLRTRAAHGIALRAAVGTAEGGFVARVSAPAHRATRLSPVRTPSRQPRPPTRRPAPGIFQISSITPVRFRPPARQTTWKAPHARPGSVPVTAGKGLTANDSHDRQYHVAGSRSSAPASSGRTQTMQQAHTTEAEIEIATPMLEREDGQTMAEYGLILTGIALVVMATTLLLGNAISATFQSIIAAL